VLTTNVKKNEAAKKNSRRFVSVICSDKYTGPQTAESEAYFQPLIDMDPLILALYYYTLDISAFNPRIFVTGTADKVQQRENWSTVHKFINDVLDKGCIVEKKGSDNRTSYLGGPAIPKDVLFAAYQSYHPPQHVARDMLGKDAFFTEFWNELDEVAASRRPRAPYAGIVGTRVNCVDFEKLQDVRKFWIDMYYGDDEKPDG
jgi:hypothetical protein